MKLHQFLPALFAMAAMNNKSGNSTSSLVEPPKKRPVGTAPEELRKPLLIGRRGKLTRKQRKAKRQ